MFVETIRQAKRLIVAVVGFTVVLLGTLMIVTPGPGLLTIILGLSILGAEFVWARRLLKRLKRTGSQIASSISDSFFGPDSRSASDSKSGSNAEACGAPKSADAVPGGPH
ncbi:MAG TPA: PGPGW domain-containing protein [Candidatus Binataceae bacterium]